VEVLLARENGFCFGVKKAVELTEAAAETGKAVHNLGQVVHNPKISERLAARGVKVIKDPADASDGIVVIRAQSEGKADSAIVTVTADQGSGNPAEHVGYYVAPNGTSGADGSKAHPWDFASALNGANGKIQPGDTVWLRGGQYKGVYRSNASGAAGKPLPAICSTTPSLPIIL